MNILLLEDDTAIAAALETFLTEKGCRVTCCDSLSRARSLLETALPDVAVLDWNLPDGEGTDLCRELRQRRPVPVSRRIAVFSRCAFRLGDRPFCGASLCAVRPPDPFLRPDGSSQRRQPAVINSRRPALQRACFFSLSISGHQKRRHFCRHILPFSDNVRSAHCRKKIPVVIRHVSPASALPGCAP